MTFPFSRFRSKLSSNVPAIATKLHQSTWMLSAHLQCLVLTSTLTELAAFCYHVDEINYLTNSFPFENGFTSDFSAPSLSLLLLLNKLEIL